MTKQNVISNFLTKLAVDSVVDVKYCGKYYAGTCVCCRHIKFGYLFFNQQNCKSCVVGKTCLQDVFDYIKI